ncbi:hypothetical protein VTO42DRAFT_6441 [Malbranchea cinnamomea]
MVPRPVANCPAYQAFIAGLNPNSLDASLEQLIGLIKRRQIDPPHGYAFATVRYLAQAINCSPSDPHAIIARITDDGKRLIEANPKLIVVGNIVRRVLSIVRDEIDTLIKEGHLPPGSDGRPTTPQLGYIPAVPSPLRHSETEAGEATDGPEAHAQSDRSMSRTSSHRGKTQQTPLTPIAPPVSMFDLLAYPEEAHSPQPGSPPGEPDKKKDLKAESLSATNEFMDELDQADDQIASYALDHIHANEVIMIYGASETVQAFLLKAATKRKFTVISIECYPNHHREAQTYAAGGSANEGGTAPKKSLTSLGIEVIVAPDSHIFALMSRVNKVILSTHAVMSNGGIVADAGTGLVAMAAKVHKIPVLVLSAVYKLSPVYPFDPEALEEYGDPAKALGPNDQDLLDRMTVVNPLTQYVSPEQIDLYITNLGAHARGYLNHVITDHYRTEELDL